MVGFGGKGLHGRVLRAKAVGGGAQNGDIRQGSEIQHLSCGQRKISAAVSWERVH